VHNIAHEVATSLSVESILSGNHYCVLWCGIAQILSLFATTPLPTGGAPLRPASGQRCNHGGLSASETAFQRTTPGWSGCQGSPQTGVGCRDPWPSMVNLKVATGHAPGRTPPCVSRRWRERTLLAINRVRKYPPCFSDQHGPLRASKVSRRSFKEPSGSTSCRVREMKP
jgi:hypothetical protein